MYETINQIGGRMTYLIGSTNGMMKKENEKILKISEKNRNFSKTVPLNTISIESIKNIFQLIRANHEYYWCRQLINKKKFQKICLIN